MGTLDGYLTNAAPMWMNLIIAPDAAPGPHTILISGSDFNAGIHCHRNPDHQRRLRRRNSRFHKLRSRT